MDLENFKVFADDKDARAVAQARNRIKVEKESIKLVDNILSVILGEIDILFI